VNFARYTSDNPINCARNARRSGLLSNGLSQQNATHSNSDRNFDTLCNQRTLQFVGMKLLNEKSLIFAFSIGNEVNFVRVTHIIEYHRCAFNRGNYNLRGTRQLL
jgi:hypothetical protein